jgi:hypothetical protein
MSNGSTITLAIKESAGGDSFVSHLYVDEAPVATNRTLSPTATQAQRELSDDYLSLFEQSQIPLVEEEALRTIGQQPFETWLADDWADVQGESSPTGRRRFVGASDVPAVLNLPWSLLRLPGEDELVGLDPTSSLRLHPMTERLAESNDEQRSGPALLPHGATERSRRGTFGRGICTFKRSVGDHEGLVILREPPGDRRISMNPAFPPHSERSFDSASLRSR